jgi:hypothetical protein
VVVRLAGDSPRRNLPGNYGNQISHGNQTDLDIPHVVVSAPRKTFVSSYRVKRISLKRGAKCYQKPAI